MNKAKFLDLPDAEYAPYVPTSLAYAPGGSRRQAVLLDLKGMNQDYFLWAWEQMHATLAMLFRHAVRHIIAPLLTPHELRERGVYGEQLMQWVEWGLTGERPLTYYRQNQWQVRLIGTLDARFQSLADTIQNSTTQTPEAPTLWWTITDDYAHAWTDLLNIQATSQVEAIKQLYGVDIPPITMLIGSGKPIVSSAIVPPILQGSLNCYWIQKPGYVLDQALFRRIVYDYAVTRQTWQADKADRVNSVIDQRDLWENAPTLGLGQRLGNYWFPEG